MGLKMSKATVYDIKNHLEKTNRAWDIFRYNYMFGLKDKIHMSQIVNKDILDLCLSSDKEPHNKNLAGDIESEHRITNENAILAVSEELKIHVENIFQQKPFNISLMSEYKKNDLWINRQKKTEFNPAHNHSGVYSFVIYADIPEEIKQEYKDSIGNTGTRGLIQFHSEMTNDKLLFNPSTYIILIFESSHMHQVYPFYSDNTRISIAGNIHEIN